MKRILLCPNKNRLLQPQEFHLKSRELKERLNFKMKLRKEILGKRINQMRKMIKMQLRKIVMTKEMVSFILEDLTDQVIKQ